MSAELAWAAGFFDGEGSTFLGRNKITHYEREGQPSYTVSTPTLSVAQVDRRPLDRFVAAIGHGKVAGPYQPKNGNAQPYYRVQIEGRDRVCAILHALWPYLGEPKREQARAAWDLEKQNRGPKSPLMPALPEDTAPLDHPTDKQWIGVDFDQTLAAYAGWDVTGTSLGTPIPLMLERVKRWLARGIEVRILTARVASNSRNRVRDVELIGNWTEMYLGKRLKVTAEKDFGMIALWDDRAVAVEPNEGLALHDHETDPLTAGEEIEMAYDGGLLKEGE